MTLLALPDEVLLVLFSHLFDTCRFGPDLDLTIFSAMRVNRQFRDLTINIILLETTSSARKADDKSRLEKVLDFEKRLGRVKYDRTAVQSIQNRIAQIEYGALTKYSGLKDWNSPPVVDRDAPLSGIGSERYARHDMMVRQEAWDWEFARL